MTNASLRKAGLLTIVLVVLAIGSWEIYLRSKGVKVSYDDGPELWSYKRSLVYQPADKATVFIGASRNKYDLDIDTWESLTGDEAIQLAEVGSSPFPILQDLGNDKNFKGKLIIDVTEGLFFHLSPRLRTSFTKDLAYYKKVTPAQHASFAVNRVLESKLVFLDKDFFSLSPLLTRLHIKDRPGVMPTFTCPMDFTPVTFDRQNVMTPRFEADTNIQNQVKSLWQVYRSMDPSPPTTGKPLDSLIQVVKVAVDNIRSRGGQVIFVRSPSSGPFRQGEVMAFPREKYWDRLLTETASPGIHFADYPVIDHFQCPEFSHLKKSDAVVYTTELVRILEQEKNWKFPHKPVR